MKRPLLIKHILACLGLMLLLGSIALTITSNRSRSGRPRAEPISTTAPQLILWAWERPTDLRFIDIRQVGVAFLAKSILLTADEVVTRPRLQSLELAEGTRLIAVARIETDREQKADLSIRQREIVTRAIMDMASLPNVSEVQIDFDATQSERIFYRGLITEVRQRLPRQVRLSITALASWCMYDDWIADLPIDEAVPMLFRMAADGKQIANLLNAGDDFKVAPCRQSYGISLDEQRPRLFPDRKLFVFNPDAWTERSVREISESKQ